MKKYVINNKGSTLILVLLITIVFSVLFLSFTTISMNAKKQNERVEDSSQAYALAEMGVEYYQEGILNIVEDYKNGKAKQTVETINSYLQNASTDNNNSSNQGNGKGNNKNNSNENTVDEDINLMINQLMNSIRLDINNFLNNNNSSTLLNNNEFKIIINDSTFPQTATDSLVWTLIVEGKPHLTNNTKKITANYKLLEADLIQRPTENESRPNVTIPSMPPQILALENSTTNLNSGSFDGSGNFFTNNVLDSPEKVMINALGNVSIGNINGMKSMDIYSNGEVVLRAPVNANNLSIYAESANFNTFNSINNSSINIYGDAIIYALENFSNNSKIFVEGDLKVTSGIKLHDSGSRVYVEGKLHITQGNSEISSGIVLVNEIEVINSDKQSIKVTNEGKLCVKDINSLPQLAKIKGQGRGNIIFLDPNLPSNHPVEQIPSNKYSSIANSYLDNHTKIAGSDEFYKACNVNSTQYSEFDLNLNPTSILTEVSY